MLDEKVWLTVEEALAMLVEREDGRVHTFMQSAGGMPLGADWDRADVVALLEREGRAKLTTGIAASMGHGWCCQDEKQRIIFVETR